MTTTRPKTKRKHQRLVLILLAIAAMLGGVLLAMSALKGQAAYFYTPAEAIAAKVEPGRAVRLGGMVEGGSLKRAADGVTISFRLTDGKASVPATFSGITPDLFKENGGAIAEGAFDASGTFRATNILAKHDERYMPREMEGIKYDPNTHKVSAAKP
ncbi:cytochrome c maturation protein CcmE [Sphingobium nicotianae]|uniref:Cytochrome c-type biogenesis protein CcmE n=1 Tax=Sphingobium nicotianae TaxID=2782607 RepID=A0A9X1AJ66_9SPHN|nr:cytochrome c maturation protein CcmE [Sphingobium nicotianae]MBT2185770.1 cytochrome c maturation protein CcmE [Sphingobium nicotianae]